MRNKQRNERFFEKQSKKKPTKKTIILYEFSTSLIQLEEFQISNWHRVCFSDVLMSMLSDQQIQFESMERNVRKWAEKRKRSINFYQR